MQNSRWIDFRQVIATVSIESVLRLYGIHIRSSREAQLRGNCPLPMHQSRTQNTFTASTVKDVWACLSASCTQARGGRMGGNVLDLVSLIENCTIREAALKLKAWFVIGTELTEHRPRERISIPNREPAINPPLRFKLSNDSSHPYLINRGITQATAKQFGLGYFSGKGCMHGRIVIPIHNAVGELVAYAGRAIDQSQPKYRLPKGFRKSLELFSFHIAKRSGSEKRVVIVEGFFDCVKVSQAGHSCVVALMGSSLSETQKQMIVESFDHAILMLDGDEPGQTAQIKIAQQLTPYLFVRSIILPFNSQPDQLSSQEIQQLLLKIINS